MTEPSPIPHSTDAERGVLCSALLVPDAVLAICSEVGVTPEWFYVAAHAEIYSAVCALANAGKPCEFITIAQHLRDRNKLDQCGGGPYLNELFVYLPTAANVRYYLELLEEKHHLRGALAVATAVTGMATRCEAHEVLEYMESACLGIRANRYRKTGGSMREVAMAAIEAIQHLYESKGRITGIETGFGELDKLTNGAHPSELTIIAARPSVGKTAFAMNVAERMSRDGVLCLFFSGEMSQAQLGQRMLCSMASVNHARVRQGFLAERDFPSLTNAAGRMKDLPLVIDDTTSPTIEYIRGVARRHRRTSPDVRLAIFVDYAGLCTTADNRARATRQLELGAVSRGAKALSKEVAAPVYLLSQLNRESSKQQRRPRLTDLRESGDLEQDADNVFLLHRPEMEMEPDDEAREKFSGVAELIIAKQRNGSVGDIVPLTFLKEFTRFKERAFA
jgi:replicative DNA helicase